MNSQSQATMQPSVTRKPDDRQDLAQETAAPDEQKSAGRVCRDDDPTCSICGGASHNEYFCAYNYMYGYLSVRTCRGQCSPGQHAMACGDFLRCFVRVSNVPPSLSEREVGRLFQRFGSLRMCALARVGTQGGARFGFVTFKRREDAEEAVDELNGHRVGDRKLRVDWAYPRAHHE